MNHIITSAEVYEVLCEILPKQNDFYETDYVEERQELLDFGIDTKEKFRDTLLKHRELMLKWDAEDFDEYHLKVYTEEYGEEYMADRIKNKYWCAYPAFLRSMLSLEFGQEYDDYAYKRDGLI